MAEKLLRVHRLRRIYVWELPVRIYHWINVLVLLVLIVTGFYIGNPLALMSGKEASEVYTMGWFRFLHFAAAYIFFFNFVFRIYWGFAGNKYANWKQFIPTTKTFWKELKTVLKMDILLMKGNKEEREHLTIGHNALAGLTYFGTFLAFLLQCLTGFGLYASMASWWFPKLFAWVPFVLGGDILTRQIHHWTMWFFILFAVIHVYLVFYHDYVEGRGEISSMGGGWKFIEEDYFEKNKPHTPNPEK
ncbi:MAG: Ni/Fe-hydrogenase, b-type cytochrome subunit [Saprospiraceae bacterium]|nr:Ni/Fe-hydrogenase, b-type cytochrome subunit [Saprospiraceae bacterium]MBK8851974.1 Ni/Fe-hydrogenase, b-type cytochrome subunit [Saprospiraceae bacterium]MBK9686628.1 Ni/Fe-hydrogenase, b-type cytochrome subunit [Saprospiraceae bacterium]MBL0082406.1 Ni/Fe-hydrogenase, b-type cytochrome subunit [Saprospiraceae bacterium]